MHWVSPTFFFWRHRRSISVILSYMSLQAGRREAMIKNSKCFFILLFVITILTGCAHMQVQQRKSELESMLNPLLGKSKEDVVLAIGVPTNTQRIGDLEVYQYYQSYGTRGNVWVSPNEYIATAGARTWEAYDKVNIYLKDGIMVKWDGYIQR